MNRIWIRKKISTLAKIISGITGVLIVLFFWIVVTTIRMPPKSIPINDFENKILINLSYDNDRSFILKIYEKNNQKYSYIIKKALTNKEKINVWSLLKSIKYISENSLPNPIMSRNVLPHPYDILKAFPALIKGTSNKGFVWTKSLFFAVWVSLRRELLSFLIVVLFALMIGIFMSCNSYIRALYMPFLVIGTFIPIAALIPLTQAFFDIGETQKIVFLSLGMFFVLLALVMKEMDEVDDIYLQTAYTLGFSQLQSVFLVNFPIALPRIWKHFASIFGLGWGYIIFAEMINVGESDFINGIGWLFIARKRRLQIADMYAIFFVIIFLAFLFSYLFDLASKLLFKYERKNK